MVKIQSYEFQGPFSINEGNFNEVPGIYVIYTSQNWLDVGETDKLKSRITNHERKSDWIQYSNGLPIWLAFLYENNSQERIVIESNLRSSLSPLCGEK